MYQMVYPGLDIGTVAVDSSLTDFPNLEIDNLFAGQDSRMLHMGHNMLVTADSYRVMFANKNVQEMLGILIPTGVSILELLYPEDIAAFLVTLNAARNNPQGSVQEFRLKSPHGNHWVEFTIYPYDLNNDGKIMPASILQLRDVTEKRLMEQVAGPTMLVSVANRHVQFNAQAYELFQPNGEATLQGVFLPELIRELITELGVENPRLLPDLQRALAQAYPNSIVAIGSKYFELKLTQNPESEELGQKWFSITMDDITDRFYLEQNVAEQLHMLKEIMQRVPFLVVRNYEMGGVVTYANLGASDFYGVGINQLVGSTEAQWNTIENYSEDAAEDRRLLAAEVDNLEVERQFVERDGLIHVYKVTKKALNEHEIMVMYDEVTEKNAAKQNILELDDRREAERAIREMLHDFATPLSSMTLLLDLGRRYLGEPALEAYFLPLREQAVQTAELLNQIRKLISESHPQPESILTEFEALQRFIDEVFNQVDATYKNVSKGANRILPSMKDSTDSMRQLLTQMREIIHSLGKGFELKKKMEPVSLLKQRLETTVNLLAVQAERENKTMKPIEAALDTDTEMSVLNVDMARVDRVLMNLIGNAVKYTRTGGEIAVSLLRNINDVVITVADNGIGIPLDDQQNIFNPLSRAKNVGEIEGTGIGLATCKMIVEAHGWTIHVESSGQDQGSKFIVTIPLQDTSQES